MVAASPADERQSDEWERDSGYGFFIFRRGDDALLGGINLNNVRRGVAQMASLGYVDRIQPLPASVVNLLP